MLAVEPEEPVRRVVDAVRARFFKRPANRNRRVAEMPTGVSSSFASSRHHACGYGVLVHGLNISMI
jgi:hypothetical protein